jgi:hypothetical protein
MGNCDAPYSAYMAETPWFNQEIDKINKFGENIYRTYVPEEANYVVVPYIGYVTGKGSVGLGGGKQLVLDLHGQTIGFSCPLP